MPRDDNEERREVSPEGAESAAGAPGPEGPEGVRSTTEPAAAAAPGFNIRRRGYLAAAALGSAAAALVGRGDGPRFGAMAVFADDLSQFQCTSNDVRILGAGQVINEPCSCTGTFTATVQFRVENNAASARSCITLHLCGAAGVPAQDVILQGSIEGKTTQTMTGQIQNFPCGAGLVCFGAAGQDDRGRCDAGVCCSTVSWGVPGQGDACPPERVITSKCRHQLICVQGRGITTLDCNASATGVQTECAVPCGGNATLRLCTTNDAALGPFTFTLNGQSFGPTADRCHDFTVGPITQTTAFTGTVTDSSGCARSASVTLTTTAVAVPQLSGALDAGCSGAATFTVANCDPATTYTYQEVDCTTGANIGASQSGLGKCSATFTFAPGAASATHCVKVTASNGSTACDQSATAQVVIPAAVTATLAVQGTPGCNGVVTLLATAGGGVAPYTFTFNGATGTVSGSGNTRTIVIQPILDGVCHSVTVTVADSRGCSATSAAASWSSCVATTFNCA